MKYYLSLSLLFVLVLCSVFAGEEPKKTPRVSIITSIYNGDEFIEGFLKDIVKQTIFNESELILVNAASPGNEEAVIQPYLKKYPNITYIKLEKDPGVYAVWNIAIKKAKANYITNANLDDRRDPASLEVHAKALDEDPTVDLVYAGYYKTYHPNEMFEVNSATECCESAEFSPQHLFLCLPGPASMWRKAMHEKAGYFSERFFSSGDMEMWNRAAYKGCKFKRIPGIYTLYYANPKGLSTKADSKREEENKYVEGAYAYMWRNIGNRPPKLLIKISSRSNPEGLINALYRYYENLSGVISYHFLITLDENDPLMNTQAMREKLAFYPNLSYYFGPWKSVIAAENRDIDKAPAFDILLLAKDDLASITKQYDALIAISICKNFPDYDGITTVSAPSQKNSMIAIGKKFYDRFGYAYYPGYQSSHGDEELKNVAKILRKVSPIGKIAFETAASASPPESNTKDNELFNQRRLSMYNLKPELIEEGDQKVWSILICSLEERKDAFDKLQTKLKNQIESNNLSDKVEVLACVDNRVHPVGVKRNALVMMSKGKYISFIDDDDDIHERYVPMIYEKLLLNPDCVSMTGIITFNGENPRKFIHSLKYPAYFEKDGVYYRPPNHLNPIKRALAIQFSFPEVSYGEDTNWAMQIAKSGVLKTEETIDEPYYFYLFDEDKSRTAPKQSKKE